MSPGYYRESRKNFKWLKCYKTSSTITHSIRARYVFPVTSNPIADGVITIDDNRIVAVGKPPDGVKVENLGNVAILPGLINAHAHLDLSDLCEPLGEPGISLVDWIRIVIDHRLVTPCGRAVEHGLQESVDYNTAAIGDIAQPGWQGEQSESVPTDVTVFLELIAPTAQRTA